MMLYGFGIGPSAGLVVDFFGVVRALILSSTMVMMTLEKQGMMGTLSARVMTGVLIVQDLAVVPMLIILPQLSNVQNGLSILLWAAIKAAVFLLAMILIGTKSSPV